MSDKDLIKKKWLERYPRGFPKPDKTVMPVPGAIALSRAGRDRYRSFIITEVLPPERCEKELRVTVVDGKLRRVNDPKKKNLAHLILVGMSSEAAILIADGRLTDDEAVRILEGFRMTNSSINE